MAESAKPLQTKVSAVVRFVGDSGDGMQLAGVQLTDASAVFGNEIATLPDYPAEIRAPQGTVAGVSGFQVHFSSKEVFSPGDQVQTLVAMNPAALKAHASAVEKGGIIIVDQDSFSKMGLRKAGYQDGENPLDDDELKSRVTLVPAPISKLTKEALAGSSLSAREASRCRNMFALGMVYWLYDRNFDSTLSFLSEQFRVRKNLPHIAEANEAVLRAGWNLAETLELFGERYSIPRADVPAGRYRKVTGNEAMGMGLIAAAQLASKELVYATYPITPASDILHYLADHKAWNVKTFQAEDEIAAVCAAIGASYGGALGVTGTSGPGLALKTEAMGLAVMTELPLVVVDVQRGGPSTGLPTKTEQSDLWQALYGRNGDCPLLVMAPKSPADCFDMAFEAARLSMMRRVPVLILSDGFIANGAEAWRVPEVKDFEPIVIDHVPARYGEEASEPFKPYTRDDKLVRPWAIPGTAGNAHRIGGLEKQHESGGVSLDPENHQRMTRIRAQKVALCVDEIPDLEVYGDEDADLLVVGWGGTWGHIRSAVDACRERGIKVAQTHFRYLNPMPKNTAALLKSYKQILVPELNDGQLRMVLRGRYLVDARGINKIQGMPFLGAELEQAIELISSGQWGDAESLYPCQGKVDPASQQIPL